MLEAQGYLYEGVRRLSFGFPSPNYAGAAIAMALPVFWGVLAYGETKWHKGWQMLLWTAEYFTFYMVCLTFSRGALAATALGLAHHLVLRWAVARPVWRVEKWALMVRPAVYAFLVAMSGLAARTGDAFSGSDTSALNRFEYWRAGLLALRHIPFFGISEIQASSYFVNWCDGIDSSRTVGGFVNSYLDWGVMWGPLALGSLIFLAVWSACYPLSIRPGISEGRRICLCSLSSAVVVFAVASFFSSLIGPMLVINISLILLCCANVGLWLILCSKKGWFLAGSVGFASLVVVAALHVPMANRWGCVATIKSTGAVSLRREDISRQTTIHDVALVCDWEVMGNAYGKEARRFIAKCGENSSVLVFPPDCENVRRIEAARVVVFGRRWKPILPLIERDAKIILFHPLGLPDETIEKPPRISIVLPAIDEEGCLSEWLDFAAKRGIPVLRTDGGHSLIENWTEVFAAQKS